MHRIYKNTKSFMLLILLILVFVFGLCLWFQYATSKSVKEMTVLLDTVAIYATDENFEKARHTYGALRARWDKSKDHWYYYLNHATIKETDLCMVRLGEFLATKQYGDARSELAALRRLLQEVRNHDIPLFHNIV